MSSKYFSNVTTLLVGVAVGLIISQLRSGGRGGNIRALSVEHAFHLGVTVKFTSADDKIYFKDLFKPLAKYVKEQELETLSYELMESDKDPLQIFILERYKNKSSYLEVHRHSKEFLTFREKFKSILDDGRATLDGHSYIETNIGFV